MPLRSRIISSLDEGDDEILDGADKLKYVSHDALQEAEQLDFATHIVYFFGSAKFSGIGSGRETVSTMLRI